MPADGKAGRRRLTVHASQLVPYLQPYVEPTEIDIHPEDDEDAVPPESRPKTRQKRGRANALNVWELARRLPDPQH